LLVDTTAQVLGLESSNRVQCTPDLMPADIIGAEVLGRRRHGQAQLPFYQGTDLHAAFDG
jgi:MoxR-like ATPase